MWRLTLGRLWRRAMMESWPLGFKPMAQRLAQVGGILVAEEGGQRAGAGDAHPVAGLAEIMGHRRDEAELAAGFADMNVTGGAAAVLVEVGQRVLFGQPRT